MISTTLRDPDHSAYIQSDFVQAISSCERSGHWWDAMALFTSLSASRFLRPSGLHDPGDDDHRVDLWNFRWIEMTFDRDTE